MKFTFNIQDKIDKLLVYAKSKFPLNHFTIVIYLWDDEDYQVMVSTGIGQLNHEFRYKKSEGQFMYRIRECTSLEFWHTVSEKEIHCSVVDCNETLVMNHNGEWVCPVHQQELLQK